MPQFSFLQSSQAETSNFVFSRILLLLYTLSGVTALAYEVLLARAMGLQFGISIFGVVITISAFMAGLGLGSITCARWWSVLRTPVILFAILELTIAGLALFIPPILHGMDLVLAHWGRGLGFMPWLNLQVGSIAALLFFPAFCMGAGFPLILRVARQLDMSLAVVYGVNTLGATFGALLPLLLLPTLGWVASMRMVAALGLVVAGGAYYLHTRLPHTQPESDKANLETPDLFSLVAYAGVGAAAIMLEVGWTRIFGMLMLRTEYVLAVILAAFLIGIAVGSIVSRWLTHGLWLQLLPLFASLFAILSLWLIPNIALWADSVQADSLFAVLFNQGMVILAITLPVTLVLGAWLPLLSARFRDAGQSGAWLYGINSCGAALGGVLAGFVLMPILGTAATIAIAALVLILSGMRWVSDKRIWWGVPLLVTLCLPVVRLPDVAALKPAQYTNTKDRLYREDAINITHVVERADGQRVLLADLQRMDASSEPTAVEVQKNQARLPLLLHNKPNTVLYLGLGTGISAAGGLDFPGLEQSAVEISRGAILAARDWFAPVNSNVAQSMTIVQDDARHYLMSHDGQYDVIIGDLFHPDMVGRSALLSLQQFNRARERLAPNGVFVQWLALNQFSVEAFQTVARTFRAAFPNAVIFVDAFRVALVGPRNQFKGADTVLANLSRLTEAQQFSVTGGEGAWTWLGRYWGPIPEWPGALQEEWLPRIEFSLPRARFNGELDLVKLLDMLLRVRPPVGRAAEMLGVVKSDYPQFERAYIATELAHRSWFAFLRKQTEEGQRLLQLAYQANSKDRWVGFALADGVLASLDTLPLDGSKEQDLLQAVIKIRPDHVEALQRLWRLAIRSNNTELAGHYMAQLLKLDPLGTPLLTSARP